MKPVVRSPAARTSAWAGERGVLTGALLMRTVCENAKEMTRSLANMASNTKTSRAEGASPNGVDENVRYLLWSRPVERGRWEGTVANWAGCGVERARALLRGEMPNPEEVAAISAASGVAEQELAYGRLVEKKDILLENLRHLLGGVEHGAKARIALQIGVHPSTISAWLSGRQRPRGSQLERLARAMGLLDGEDLETRPLFLSLDPVAAEQRRVWMREQIDRLDDRTLAELFPALKRLLESP